MTKKTVLALTSVALAALGYAALDDITTGSEASFALEWSIVGVAVVWFSVLAAGLIRPRSSEQ